MSTAAPRTIKAYAAFSKDEPVKQWQYEARLLRSEDVEIKVSHCGICGSDVHTIDGGWGPFQVPCVPGHEIIGEITQVGSGVTTLKVGDRVGVGAQAWACLNKDADKPCKACASGADAYCPRMVWSFNDKYEDGTPAYGGFAEYVRAPSSYTFKIPANISSEEAGPLMCAGATVFTPLKEAGVKPGDRVGIIGIGGLGHVAVQFAKAMGATVVAFSRSDKKKAEALQLGADEFVNYGDDAEAQKAAGTVDVLLLTADATNMPYDLFMTFLSIRGTLIMVGLPNDQLKLYPFNLVPKGRKIVGSCIGSIADIKEMLQLASKKNVRPVVQVLPISEVNKALGMVRDGSVRYRAVLKHEH